MKELSFKCGFDISKVFANNGGEIDNIEISKSPVRESGNDEEILEMHIRQFFDKKDVVNFKIHPIKKKRNGLRTAKVTFTETPQLARVAAGLNG